VRSTVNEGDTNLVKNKQTLKTKWGTCNGLLQAWSLQAAETLRPVSPALHTPSTPSCQWGN